MEKSVWDCVIKAELGIITCGADEQRRRRLLTFIIFILSDDFGNLFFFYPSPIYFKNSKLNKHQPAQPHWKPPLHLM